MKKPLALAFCAAVGALALPARAEERTSPLADAPAIRHRLELRTKRFELGAGAGMTLMQDFYHAILLGPRVAYHMTDWLSIAGIAQFNVTPNMKTAFNSDLEKVLPAMATPMDVRTPTYAEAKAGMNKIGQIIALQAELVPFTGKVGLFRRLFASYDTYLFAGPGFVNFTADEAACAAPRPCSSAVTGMKVGATFGLGAHFFVNQAFALQLEFRDVLLRNNPAGRDVTGNRKVTGDDLSWDSTYVLSVNATFFFPRQVKISD